MPLEGLQLGRYQLLRLIGSGGMGEVYLAEDARIEQQVAIKVLRAELLPYPREEATKEASRLFIREVKAIAKLDHPNILPLFDYGEAQIEHTTVAYLVMPFRKEGSLANWLKQRSGSDQLSIEEIAHIVQQAANALQHAHNHEIIHQDVKPSNFLIRSRPEQPAYPDLLLTDFGIARLSTGGTASLSIRGTPTSMPPEQWDGQPVPATDQYALAVMTYQLLTGYLPFQGGTGQVIHQHFSAPPPPPSSIRLDISPVLDAVILHALEKKPEARFPSIAEFAYAFQEAALLATQQPKRTTPLSDSRPLEVLSSSKLKAVTPVLDSGTTIPPFDSGATIPPGAALSLDEPGNHTIEAVLTRRPSAPLSTTIIDKSPLPEVPATPQPQQDILYKWRMVVLPVLALILILSGILFYISINNNIAMDNSNTHATATSRANATDSASAATGTATTRFGATATAASASATASTINATATAVSVGATATARAGATATVISANPNPYAPNTGTLALYDPLHDNSAGYKWQTTSDCAFTGGAYLVTARAGYFHPCYTTATSYSNFAFEARMTILQGNCGGFTVRADMANAKLYLFQVCQSGSYGLYLYIDNTGFNSMTLTSGYSAAINTGLNQSNVIALVANGSTLDLYVNHQKVDSVIDGTYTQGYISLSANATYGTTEVAYTDARVWIL